MGFWGTNSNSGSKAADKGQGYYDLRDHPLTLAGSCSVWKPRKPLLNSRRSVAVEAVSVSVRWYWCANSVRASCHKTSDFFPNSEQGNTFCRFHNFLPFYPFIYTYTNVFLVSPPHIFYATSRNIDASGFQAERTLDKSRIKSILDATLRNLAN